MFHLYNPLTDRHDAHEYLVRAMGIPENRAKKVLELTHAEEHNIGEPKSPLYGSALALAAAVAEANALENGKSVLYRDRNTDVATFVVDDTGPGEYEIVATFHKPADPTAASVTIVAMNDDWSVALMNCGFSVAGWEWGRRPVRVGTQA